MNFGLTMVAFAGVTLVQNMAFTAVSRSRNSGDVWHHAKWSVVSNGVWFCAQVFMASMIWSAIEKDQLWHIAVAAGVYVTFTTIGSCAMMAHMLKHEKGRQLVGSR